MNSLAKPTMIKFERLKGENHETALTHIEFVCTTRLWHWVREGATRGFTTDRAAATDDPPFLHPRPDCRANGCDEPICR